MCGDYEISANKTAGTTVVFTDSGIGIPPHPPELLKNHAVVGEKALSCGIASRELL
jgi:hypothetical protein